MVYISGMNNVKRAEMFRRWSLANPDPKTELQYSSAFELLVAVTLSAQATDVSVNKATAKLFPDANTPEQILALGVDGLKPYIRTIGLFNTKAKNVIEACRVLCEEHGGVVPEDREALEALPGVGRKTANVVLNTAFRQIAMAVDTHIFRVSNRTGLAPGKTVLAVEKSLMKFVPKEYLLDAHHWLILHGRYVCLARTPRCPECPVLDLCDYRPKTQLDSSGKLTIPKAARKSDTRPDGPGAKRVGKKVGKKADKATGKKVSRKAGKKTGKASGKKVDKKLVNQTNKKIVKKAGTKARKKIIKKA